MKINLIIVVFNFILAVFTCAKTKDKEWRFAVIFFFIISLASTYGKYLETCR